MQAHGDDVDTGLQCGHGEYFAGGTALGLGSVWIGVQGVEPFVKKISKVMKLPDHVQPLGIAYIGYAAETKEPRTQYNAKRIYQETYDSERKHRARPKNLKHT